MITNVAIIGCGNIANVHVQAVLKRNCKIVALCDIDQTKAESLEKKYNFVAPIFDDYQTMLNSIKIDVVHVLTPHYLHAEMIVYALNKGINVLSEKPLCINREQLDSILEAEHNSTAKLGVCLQNRYNPSNLCVKQLLHEDDVLAITANVVWNRGEQYYQSSAWKGKWATEGGGSLINQALHTLDLALWYLGMPNEVIAHKFTDRLRGIIEVEDVLTAHYIYDNGKSLDFFSSNCSSAMFPVQILIKTEKHMITLHPDHLLVDRVQFDYEAKGIANAKQCWGDGHFALIDDFYKSIEQNKTFWINGLEASKVMNVIFATYQSDGNKVKVIQ